MGPYYEPSRVLEGIPGTLEGTYIGHIMGIYSKDPRVKGPYYRPIPACRA